MFELLGLIFGGVSRLAQHWMELRDKDKERGHEAVMFDKQVALAAQKQANDVALRTMDADAANTDHEWAAIQAAVAAQAAEAAAAGGWVAKLSACVRPLVTFWLLGAYSVAKVTMVYLAVTNGTSATAILGLLYSNADATLLASILSFWFVDRSLRQGKLGL